MWPWFIHIRRPLPELERASLHCHPASSLQSLIHHPADCTLLCCRDCILLCCRLQDPAYLASS